MFYIDITIRSCCVPVGPVYMQASSHCPYAASLQNSNGYLCGLLLILRELNAAPLANLPRHMVCTDNHLFHNPFGGASLRSCRLRLVHVTLSLVVI